MADFTFNGLEFNKGVGDEDWFLQTSTVNTGPSAFEGGNIIHDQTTRLDLVNPCISGGTLEFYWKVSSEEDYDYLIFYINGTPQLSASGEVDWTLASYSISAGDSIYWIYEKDDSVSEGADTGYLDSFSYNETGSSTSSSSISTSSSSQSSSSESKASNIFFEGLYFTTDGSEGPSDYWFEQSRTVHSSPTALQAGDISNNQYSKINLVVPYSGTLKFWWKVDSEEGSDYLTFYKNGLSQDQISGDTAWTSASYPILDSDVAFWVYEKDSSTSTGQDTGWLDTFTFTISGSSSSSSSSSISESSSSSSSSTSLSSGRWTWGQQTGVTTDYVLSFANGRLIPWEGTVSGSGDAEAMIVSAGPVHAISEPAYVRANTSVSFEYNQYRGFRNDNLIGDILYRTASTRAGCLSAQYQVLTPNTNITSLGWVQVSLTWQSSSSLSSSSSSSTSTTCYWEDYTDSLIVFNTGGKDFATWNASAGVWESVLHGKDSKWTNEFGAAEYIYLVFPAGIFADYRPRYVRVTHNRAITDAAGIQPILYIDDFFSGNQVAQAAQYESGEVIECNFQVYPGIPPFTQDMYRFYFYHTGATPMEISKIEFCSLSSSSSSSVSDSSSSVSSSSSSVSSSSSSVSSSSSSGICTLNYFNTTYWQADGPFASWDGSAWDSFANNLRIKRQTSFFDWYTGLDPTGIEITVDSINGGSSVFDFTLTMDTGWSPVTVTDIALSDGETYTFDLREGGYTPRSLAASTTSDSFSITDLVFIVSCDQSSSSSSSSSSVSSSSSSSSVSSSSFSSTSSSSKSSSSESTTPVEGNQIFDNSWWSGYVGFFGTWDGTKWVAGFSTNYVAIEPTTSAGSPNFGWETGFDPDGVYITLDNITGGSGTFQLDFFFDNNPDVQETGVAFNNGQTYNWVLSAGGDTPTYMAVTNEAGGANTMAITDLLFYPSTSSSSVSNSSSSSSRSGAGYTYFDNTYWIPYNSNFATWDGSKWIPNFDDNGVYIQETGSWNVGFDPQYVDITIDDITGGSSTFEFAVLMTGSTDATVTSVPLSSGQTYTMDLTTAGQEPYRMNFINEAGSGQNLSVTNIVFWD